MNVYFSITHCKTDKEIWDTLQVIHEVTEDVNKSKINTLTGEYKLFCMKSGETRAFMHMRFSHIINKLENLGKITSNQDCDNKIFRSKCKE